MTQNEQIKKQFLISAVVLYVPLFTLVPYMVYGVNGVTDFTEGFIQMTIILVIMGLFGKDYDIYCVDDKSGKAREI